MTAEHDDAETMRGPDAPPLSPLERYLRRPSPTIPLGDFTRGASVVRWVRACLARAVMPTLTSWQDEMTAADNDLRDGLGWVSHALTSEQVAREQLDRRADELAQMERASAQHIAALTERLDELEKAQRVARAEIERQQLRISPPTPDAPHTPELATAVFDYLPFENTFRGSEELIRERQSRYIETFADCGPVLDIGCGRGEFLELLRDAGVPARGIDSDTAMVLHAQSKGLDVVQADLFDYLAELPLGSLGGILCSHVIEHLPASAQIRLVRLAGAALRPGGRMVFETPNPQSLIAGSINFYCDPTHLRPVYPDTLAFLVEQEGFHDVRVEFLSPAPAEVRLPVITPVDGPLRDTIDQVRESLDRLDRIVFGYQEYAVVGTRD